jgi:uncharacterized protein involved in tellurium resistance
VTADPRTAAPRPDLTFLRHRATTRQAAAAVADFINGRAPHPQHHPHAQPAQPAAPPAPTPAPVSGSLDLSAPAAPPPAAAPPPTPAAAPAPTASSSLDLSAAPEPAPAVAAPSVPEVRVHQDRRIRAGGQQLLTLTEPTVTLTRVQSGVGQLEIEAICSPAVGDLHIGAAYQLRDGLASTVQYAEGNRFAPSSRRPVIVAGREEYEHLRLDLRRSRELERLAVYAFSQSRSVLTWGGTLVVSTFGGARIELPLESLHPGRMAVLLSVYNLDGEFVVRAEMETIHDGDIREATRAYGYDRITWRDDRSPVD